MFRECCGSLGGDSEKFRCYCGCFISCAGMFRVCDDSLGTDSNKFHCYCGCFIWIAGMFRDCCGSLGTDCDKSRYYCAKRRYEPYLRPRQPRFKNALPDLVPFAYCF